MIRVAKHLLRNDQSPIRSSDIVVSRVTDGQQCQTTGHCVEMSVLQLVLKKWIFRKSGYLETVDISKKWILLKNEYLEKVDV